MLVEFSVFWKSRMFLVLIGAFWVVRRPLYQCCAVYSIMKQCLTSSSVQSLGSLSPFPLCR